MSPGDGTQSPIYTWYPFTAGWTKAWGIGKISQFFSASPGNRTRALSVVSRVCYHCTTKPPLLSLPFRLLFLVLFFRSSYLLQFSLPPYLPPFPASFPFFSLSPVFIALFSLFRHGLSLVLISVQCSFSSLSFLTCSQAILPPFHSPLHHPTQPPSLTFFIF